MQDPGAPAQSSCSSSGQGTLSQTSLSCTSTSCFSLQLLLCWGPLLSLLLAPCLQAACWLGSCPAALAVSKYSHINCLCLGQLQHLWEGARCFQGRTSVPSLAAWSPLWACIWVRMCCLGLHIHGGALSMSKSQHLRLWSCSRFNSLFPAAGWFFFLYTPVL